MPVSLATQIVENIRNGVVNTMQNAVDEAPAPGAFPVDGYRLSRLAQAVEGLSREQLRWASGYLAGLAEVHTLPSPQATPSSSLTILYASVGGNARAVAEELAAGASTRGLMPRLVSADQYRVRDLAKEKLVYFVISTQGEGEPPEGAQALFRYLEGKPSPKLDDLDFAIFGLGDSSYAFFNQAAKDLEGYLQAAGGTAVVARIDADVDYAAQTQAWFDQVLELAEQACPMQDAQVIPLQRPPAPAVRHDRHRPYRAEVLENRRITTTDAVAAVHHLALAIDPAAIRYRPGDALGVLFRNDPALVDELLSLTGLSGDAQITVRDEPLSLYDALRSRLELTQLHPGVVRAWADIVGDSTLSAVVDDKAALRTFAAERQVIDLLRAYPGKLGADGLVALLHPMQPRLYSIASSQSEYPDEVHLTVATLAYQAHGRRHLGAASGHLTRRVEPGDVQAVYVAENNGFRLPRDPGAPVIMVGSGTGIAPFRAFLQERQAVGSQGAHWLVFGNRHFHRDFLYQTDWIGQRDAGRLDRVSLAFSRDTDDRPYVQNRLQQEGAELYRWLRDGAHLYVCGSLAMEKAVRGAVQEIAREYGGLSEQGASDYIDGLQSQGRYSKDAY